MVDYDSIVLYECTCQHRADHRANQTQLNTSNMTAVTKVRSASFRLVFDAQHISANSVNFLITRGLSATIFHSTSIFCVYAMALYWPTLQFYVCMYVSLLVCGQPGVLLQHSYYVAKSIYHRRVSYHVLSLCNVCIQSSGIILIP